MGVDRKVRTGDPLTQLLLRTNDRIDKVERAHALLKSAHRSPTVPMYDPEMPLDAVDGQVALKTVDIPYVPPTRKPYYYENGDWHPFVHIPLGLLAGYGSITYAVTIPGGLLARYQLRENPFGDALDTAGNPLGPFDTTYVEETGGVDPLGGAQAVWDGSQAVSRIVDHPSFGTGDDGAARFNYLQRHAQNAVTYPGSRFDVAAGEFTWNHVLPNTDHHMQSVSFFFRPRSGGLILQGVLGKSHFNETNDGFNGWGFTWDPITNTFAFTSVNGGGPPARSFTLEVGGSIAPDEWYHAVVTIDPATDTWSLYMNGVLVDTAVHGPTYDPADSGGLNIGTLRGLGGSFADNSTRNQYFYGDIDEIDIYEITLTPADVGAIYAARGAGYGTTIEPVTLGAGDPNANPGAIGSGTSAAKTVISSKGDGSTEFAYPTVDVLVDGA